MDLPLIKPNPPKLSLLQDELEAIERSGIYSNHGPVARRFEAAAAERLFGGEGACLAVANATLGLMIALRQAVPGAPDGRFALMPSLTFAATAQAALWAGFTPLLCDSDPDDWSAAPRAEERLLADHGARIAAIVPYATFGTDLDLDRYAWLARRYDVAVVVDAAASLGTIDANGRGFGSGSPLTLVFSMHATKTFATAEGGLIYSAEPKRIEALRAMAGFGFERGRSATLPGLNAKLGEVSALLALTKLGEIDAVADHRAALTDAYRAGLDGFGLQRVRARRQASQFMSLLLPPELAGSREAIVAALATQGIGAGCYFSPHLAEQPYFKETCRFGPLPVADALGAQLLSLPVTDAMTLDDVARVCTALRSVVGALPVARPAARARRASASYETVLVGGGPAGTALLTAAAKQGRLGTLAAGLAIVEAGDALGSGRLGGYAISSDSTAETFLTSAKDIAEPAIAALLDHPAAQAVAAHAGGLGVPLATVGRFLDANGAALQRVVADAGGTLLMRHEAVSAQRIAGGGWTVRLRAVDGGAPREIRTRSLVIAAGGDQPRWRLEGERVAGLPLVERYGDRLIQSDELLAIGGIEAIRTRLAGVADRRIVIVGGSTSAVTAANALLVQAPDLVGKPGALTIAHRRPLRPFYPSVEAALAEGFTDFDKDDICPVSGFVYRLAGFRLEARDLVLRALEIGGRAADPRLALHRIDPADDAATIALLDGASLIVAALGYRPRALPLFDAAGQPIRTAAGQLAYQPFVDGECRVVDGERRPIPDVYAMGLAAGFVPHGSLGGEASFSGQANGLWLWQNGVGSRIVDQLLDHAGSARGAGRAVA